MNWYENDLYAISVAVDKDDNKVEVDLDKKDKQ